MYCQTCGSEIPPDVKYCNRCGANVATAPPAYPVLPPPKPIRLTLPSIVMGLTIVIGIGIIFDSMRDLAGQHVHPAALAWMVIAGMATLFGCNALILRFWMKVLTINRETYRQQPPYQQPSLARPAVPAIAPPQFTPRLQPGSVTEHTTRTFSPAYREDSERK